MPFTTVARLSELPAGTGKQVTINGQTIAVFAEGERVFAIGGICPHRGAPLSEGMCQQGQVVCPWHAARFDLTSGQNLCPPARSPVAAFKVQVVGDEVQIEL